MTAAQNDQELVANSSSNKDHEAKLNDQLYTKGDPLYDFNTLKKGELSYEKPLVIDENIKLAILETSNGCGIGNFIIPSTGDSSQGTPPVIGSIVQNWPPIFMDLDTIPGAQIMGVAFARSGVWPGNSSVIGSGPYIIISDSGMFSYSIPWDFNPGSSISKIGSLFIPNIRRVATQITIDKTNPIVLFVEDSANNHSLRFYSYPDQQELFSFAFNVKPEIFEVIDDGLYISGQDTSGANMLYHFGASSDTLFATYPLNNLTSNAQEILTMGDSLFILSSPGDSITILTTINKLDSTLTQTVAYQYSGARATHNEFKGDKLFTFQPTSDSIDSVLNKQILVLNPVINDLDTFLINLELDIFKHPVQEWSGFGYFDLQWIGARWVGSGSDTVYLKQSSEIVKLETPAFPQYINATFGCWISIPNNELEKIEFKLYPNPATSDVTIKLSGLEKGRQYNLDIVDLGGKVYYSTSLMAYQEIQIPLNSLAKGVFFIKLDTGRNVLTQKLIIE